MISEYFPRAFIQTCDDDGIYYIRQLDEVDGMEGFEGIVWYGQRFESQPLFANVFIGKLKHGARIDDHGGPWSPFRVDAWEGRFFDVPKGRLCAANDLNIESLSMDIGDITPGCDLPETYLRRTSTAGFGGRAWPLPSRCWSTMFEEGRIDVPPPPLPPRFRSALEGSLVSSTILATRLSSRLVPPGFERRAPNLTGQWRGDDLGIYYITEPKETNDVVWYAEHPLARPFAGGARPVAARAWANVFWGERSGADIAGLWADLPRGMTRGAGKLRLVVEGADLIRITSATGGYGGHTLQRITSREVSVRVESLTINESQERADEPLIYLFFFKLDGDTVDLDNLTTSTATVEPRPEISFGTLGSGSPTPIPEDLGSFETTLTSIRTTSGRAVTSDTKVGVIAYGIELDRGERDSFRERRHAAWMGSQTWSLNSALRRDSLPTSDELRSNANRILTQWRWRDTDDLLSGGLELVTLRELIETPLINRELVLEGSGGRYTLDVQFEATSRVNDSCL